APDAGEIRAELVRMTASDVFSASPQLVAFLNFVVEAALNGKSDRIKGYVIGVEVMRRPVNFDPHIDPIVRVEATRLRRAIERYYAGPGEADDVIIGIPLGGYVPVISRRPISTTAPAQSRDPSGGLAHLVKRRASFKFAVALSPLVLMIIAAIFVWRPASREPLITQSASARVDTLRMSEESLPPGNGMPTLVLRPIESAGTPDPQSISSAALLAKLSDAFSRFDAINIRSGSGQPDESGDYVLKGLVEYAGDGAGTAEFGLRDIAAGNVAWSRTFERIRPGPGRAAAEDSIVFELASSLLQPYGIVRSRERVKFLANGAGDPRYRCLLLAADAFRSFVLVEHEQARQCLERLTSIDPAFGDGYSYLAVIHNREFLYGFGRDAADPRGLERAMALARRGIELNPTSARAYQVLSTVLFSRRDDKAAFAAVEKAMALNKYDLIILGDFGGRLILSGEIDRGLNMLARSADYGTVRPSWHHFYLFLGNYLTGDFAAAAHHADEMTDETFSYGLVAHALTAMHDGERDKATKALEHLVALRSAWRNDPRGELKRLIPATWIVDRLADDLVKAGLPTVPPND
ncbi:MAG TPA: hypothetical protein VGH49_01225, partial [Xanthobacteraceae bacterium]